MENQNPEGAFNQEMLDLISEISAMEKQLETLCRKMKAPSVTVSLDQRWAEIGHTHLQEGIMALVRAVVRPDSS